MGAAICWDASSLTRLCRCSSVTIIRPLVSHCARTAYFRSVRIPVSRLVISTVPYSSPISLCYVAHPNSLFPRRGDIAIIWLHLYHIASTALSCIWTFLLFYLVHHLLVVTLGFFVVSFFFRNSLYSLGGMTCLQRRSKPYLYYNLLFVISVYPCICLSRRDIDAAAPCSRKGSQSTLTMCIG